MISFRLSYHIWFVLHMNERNEIKGLEEHDMREGGSMTKPQGITWKEFFIERVKSRSDASSHLEEAEQLIATLN